jgi:uroporphyrin-III C-methyltransferase
MSSSSIPLPGEGALPNMPDMPDMTPVPERFASAPEFTDPAAGSLGVPRPPARRFSIWTLLALALGAAGLLASGLLWQKLNNVQEELARRSLDSGSQATEARTLARQAEEVTRELAARLALQETRLSEVSLQRTQLEELMQSLSRSRDENLVVDMESSLRLAQQQAQLTGSAEPLLAALRSAEQRLQRAAQPRLNPLQRAIAKDTERIKAAVLTDVPTLMLRLDELVRLTDELPVANAMPVPGATRTAPVPPAAPAARSSAPPAAASSGARAVEAGEADRSFLERLPGLWLQRGLDAVREEARKLLRVSRIDQPEAALLSPEQSFFLRENFKLRLLNARLSLLSRQTEAARSDLIAANAWLVKYFDPASRKTQAAAQLLQQVQGQLRSSELPRLDETFAAISTAAAGR